MDEGKLFNDVFIEGTEPQPRKISSRIQAESQLMFVVDAPWSPPNDALDINKFLSVHSDQE